MKFYDDLPYASKFSSQAIIDDLKNHPGQYGEFWVQRPDQNSKQARQKATNLRAYVKRLNLPVTIEITVDDAGLVHCFAVWNG